MTDLTFAAARLEIAEMVINANILGLTPSYHCGLLNKEKLANHHDRLRAEAKADHYSGHQSFNWEQSWGVGCNLSISWKTEERRVSGKTVKLSVPTCNISWSSTGRDIISARAAIMLYSSVVDLATVIESHFRDRHVEDMNEEYERRYQESQAKRKAELDEFIETLTDGATFDYEDKSLPRELKSDLRSCNANKSKDSKKRCGAPTKILVWSAERQLFMARCGKHKGASACKHDNTSAEEKAA